MLMQDQVDVFQWLLYIKIWWAYVGTLSDFATLFRHNNTKRWPTSGVWNRRVVKINKKWCEVGGREVNWGVT